MDTKKVIVLLFVLILLSSVAIYFYRPAPLTVLSVSNIKIEPQGYEDEITGEWKGSFWVILMITDCTDQIATYKFDNTVSDDYGQDKIGDKKLIPTATIEIKINPEQPYWGRPLEVHSYNVYPKTYGFWRNWLNQYGKTDEWTPRLDVDVWQFGTDYWTLHTPFRVSVYKNGELIGESGTIDTIGGTQTFRIPSSGEEYITVQDLGKIGHGFTEPTFDILMFSESTVFRYSDELRNKIKYDVCDLSYSNYWFGGGNIYTTSGVKVERWEDDGSPAHHFRVGDFWDTRHAVGDDDFPGSDVTTNIPRPNDDHATPVSADIWNDQPNLKPYGKSLVNYLKSEHGGHETINLNVWNQGVSVVDSKLRVNLPFGSMSSLITLKISTELADTIVWTPQVGNFKITEFYKIGDIPDRKLGYLKVKQLSDVDSSGTVMFSVSPSNLPVDINPPTIGTGTMTLGEEKVLTFEMTNLGTDTELTGTLTATITNSIGSVTDQKSVEFRLLKKGFGNTVLTVYTLDKETRAYVSGISLVVNWEGGSTTGITSEGSWTYDFGAVHPLVTVTSAETLTYKSATDSKLLEVGTNSITLELVSQEAPPEFPWFWIWIIVAVIVAVIVIVAVALILRRR